MKSTQKPDEPSFIPPRQALHFRSALHNSWLSFLKYASSAAFTTLLGATRTLSYIASVTYIVSVGIGSYKVT